ncbi:hypothetical protein [Streptomyces sp. AK02-04a]|uniref:hypothetical protein n=1 Tax=Streptomyces sp. AK02-04a TaxID=3028649 RepID=UPI0029A520CE|nr:hypothetical protein [Streptomyces sp. AK02-04a]MDX3763956.1 hypothetical protein [Streptomyces sp. AK02-04a]
MQRTSPHIRAVTVRAAVALLFATLIGSAAAVPTQAAVLSASCTGTEDVTFDPGLTLIAKPTHVTVNGNLSSCQTSAPGITSATYREEPTDTLGCAAPVVPGTGTRTYRWNAHDVTSTLTYTRTVSNVGGAIVVTYTGTITSGLFNGHTATQIITQTPPNPLLCATEEGITATSGPVTLAIV